MLGISEILYLNYIITLIYKKKYLQTILTKFSNHHCDGIFLDLLFFNIIGTYNRIKLLNITRMKQNTGSPNKFLVRKNSVKVKIKQSNFDSCKIIKTKIYSIGIHYNFALEIINSLIKNMSHLFGTNLSFLSLPKILSFFYIIDKYCININTLPGCENYMFIFTSKINLNFYFN